MKTKQKVCIQTKKVSFKKKCIIKTQNKISIQTKKVSIQKKKFIIKTKK